MGVFEFNESEAGLAASDLLNRDLVDRKVGEQLGDLESEDRVREAGEFETPRLVLTCDHFVKPGSLPFLRSVPKRLVLVHVHLVHLDPPPMTHLHPVELGDSQFLHLQ